MRDFYNRKGPTVRGPEWDKAVAQNKSPQPTVERAPVVMRCEHGMPEEAHCWKCADEREPESPKAEAPQPTEDHGLADAEYEADYKPMTIIPNPNFPGRFGFAPPVPEAPQGEVADCVACKSLNEDGWTMKGPCRKHALAELSTLRESLKEAQAEVEKLRAEVTDVHKLFKQSVYYHVKSEEKMFEELGLNTREGIHVNERAESAEERNKALEGALHMK